MTAQDREAVFKVRLPAGPSTMKSWFLDKAGNELLGAYYAYVIGLGRRKRVTRQGSNKIYKK